MATRRNRRRRSPNGDALKLLFPELKYPGYWGNTAPGTWELRFASESEAEEFAARVGGVKKIEGGTLTVRFAEDQEILGLLRDLRG